MPKPAPLLPAHLKAYVTERYLADVPPRDLVDELAARFQVTVRVSALRQWLTRSGLGKRRKDLDAKTCRLVSSAKVDALAKAKAAEPRAQLQKWATRTVAAADKALELAEGTSKPRDLASSMAAANSAIRLYRLCVGIDGVGSGGPAAARFNFNFASIPMPRADGTPASPAISVTVVPDAGAAEVRSPSVATGSDDDAAGEE